MMMEAVTVMPAIAVHLNVELFVCLIVSVQVSLICLEKVRSPNR